MDERRDAGAPAPTPGAGERTQRDRGVYIISVAAELVGVHPQTLRIYERKGLLSPSRTAGNTRRYSERDIARLQTIQRLTQEGVNLAGVKVIVEMENELDRMRERVLAMRAEMERAEEGLRREIDRIRRERQAEIVPASDVDRLRRRLRVPAQPRDAGPARRRPIALGPGQERRGPIAVGPGS